MSLRSEATLFGFWFLLPRVSLPFAWTVKTLPPSRLGPSVRLASKASTRKRFVLCIDVTFRSLRTEVLPVLDEQLAHPPLQGLCQIRESDVELCMTTT